MKTLAIIPCCGFGTRMNMTVNRSKELMGDPHTFEPLIKWHIDLCKQYDIEPLILVRPEKTDLIEYCNDEKINHVVMHPGQEWTETVYLSSPYWRDNNILLLPDSRFFPTNVLKYVKDALDIGTEASFGVFNVDDPSKWCCLTPTGIYEKRSDIPEPFMAIGIFGFTKEFGLTLFEGLSRINFSSIDKANVYYRMLDKFLDLTRTGKIEEYE